MKRRIILHIELYKKVSDEIMEIVKKYSPKYEIVSLDEAYLDPTEYSNILQNVRMFGEKIGVEMSYKKVEKLAKKIEKRNLRERKINLYHWNWAKQIDIDDLPGIGLKTAN